MKKLLLLHGALGSKNQFDSLVQLLSQDYEVFALDFYGHGSASEVNDPFTIEGFAAQVNSWLEQEDLMEIDVFGYSMGGYVALKLASEFPGKVNRIFTLATKFDWSETAAAKEVRMLDAGKIETKVPAFAADLAHRHGASNWKMVLEKTADMMLHLGSINGVLNNLSQLENKVQIGLGDRDMMVSLEETIGVYRQLKNASLVIFPETPHPLEKVNPERLRFEIKQFFS